MKRPLLVIGIAYAVTTWCAFFLDSITALLLSAACTLTALICLRLLPGRFRPLSAALLSGAVALAAYSLYCHRVVQPLQSLAGKTVELNGVVTAVDAPYFTLQADLPSYPGLPRRQTVSLRSYPAPEAAPGDMVRCRAVLTPVSGSGYYRTRGIHLAGDLEGTIERVPAAGYRITRALLRLRSRFEDNLYLRLSTQSAGLLSAMVLGLQDNVDPQVYSAVNRAGTAHLLAVSGLHLSVLTAFVLRMADRFKLPKWAGTSACFAAGLVFAALTGFSASISRAFIMSCVMLLARAFSKRADPLSSLGLALLLICSLRPWWMLGRGLWLSAGSTLGILMYGARWADAASARLEEQHPRLGRRMKPLAEAAVLSIAAYVFTIPVFLAVSGWISLVSPIANMLVAPFVAPTLIGGMLCAALPDAVPLMRLLALLTDLGARLIAEISELTAALPFATASLDEGYLLIWLAGALCGGAILLALRAGKEAWRCGAVLLALTFSAGSLSLRVAERDTLQLVSIARCDAAVLLRGDDAVILGTPGRHEVGRLISYLNFRGVRRISAVIAADCGEQIDSALLRLAQSCEISCIIGPNDGYILGQLELALPDSAVFSGGYAQVEVLGGAQVSTDLHSGEIRIQAGRERVVKTDVSYRASGEAAGNAVVLYKSGVMRPPPGRLPLVEPVGTSLHGETRLLLHLR